ncbi:MAG: DUF6152 family protein [Gammaproteobacteria bacterium]
MRTSILTIALLTASWPALGHHSITAFYDQNRRVEIEGVVTEVFWRNPHTGFTIEVVNDEGVVEEWVTEGNTTSQLVRNGFTRDSIKVGDRVRAAGRASRRGDRMIFGSPSHVLLPSGEEVSLRAASEDETELASAADAAGTGIFKVWSFETRYQLRNPFVLTPEAQAALDAYDARTDDPSLQCIPPGMPNAILNPYPIELIDEGDRIVLRIEEWGQQRVIHMTEEARSQTPEPSHLGYSVGRWEGDTLVVNITRLNFPYLDQDGRPMSENATMRERFTMSEDETELQYEVVISDPEYLVEPAIWDHTWYYEPGDEFLPGIEEGERFECEMRDADISIYR